MKGVLDYLPDKSDFPKGVYWEVRLETTAINAIEIKNGEVEQIIRSDTDRGNVRILKNGGWGFSSFSKLDNVKEHVKRAGNFASSVDRGDARVIELLPVEASVKTAYKRHPNEVTLDEKLGEAKKIENMLKEHKRAEITQVSYSDTVRRTVFLNSDGRLIDHEEVFIRGVLRLTGKANGVPETSTESIRIRGGFEEFVELENSVQTMFKRFDDLLIADDNIGGVYNCIIDPKLTGVFIHEAFGHTSEADSFYRDQQQKDVMRIGRRLGSDAVTVFDDATMDPRLCGSYAFDDEGVEGKRTTLLDKGILTEHLHNRMTAAMMGEAPTGNARAINASHPPIVRMSNTYIQPGEATYGELLKELGNGLLVCDSRGGNGGEEFTFSAAIGYLIENGEVTGPVKNLTVSGNLFTTLNNITACSNTLEMFSPGGGCGKGGQSPLPVGMGGPYVMIKDALIGGK